MQRVVTTWYLEMSQPEDLRPPHRPGVELVVQQVQEPCGEFSRFLYTAVGGDWFWVDKLGWTYDQWQEYASRPDRQTWVGYQRGAPVGYFELDGPRELGVEIAYFGLLPAFIGRGFGGALLTAAVERAWQLRPTRVWLHTCTLDHPHALANYQARGFRLYKDETYDKDLPEQPPGPWPGAQRGKSAT